MKRVPSPALERLGTAFSMKLHYCLETRPLVSSIYHHPSHLNISSRPPHLTRLHSIQATNTYTSPHCTTSEIFSSHHGLQRLVLERQEPCERPVHQLPDHHTKMEEVRWVKVPQLSHDQQQMSHTQRIPMERHSPCWRDRSRCVRR